MNELHNVKHYFGESEDYITNLNPDQEQIVRDILARNMVMILTQCWAGPNPTFPSLPKGYLTHVLKFRGNPSSSDELDRMIADMPRRDTVMTTTNRVDYQDLVDRYGEVVSDSALVIVNDIDMWGNKFHVAFNRELLGDTITLMALQYNLV